MRGFGKRESKTLRTRNSSCEVASDRQFNYRKDESWRCWDAGFWCRPLDSKVSCVRELCWWSNHDSCLCLPASCYVFWRLMIFMSCFFSSSFVLCLTTKKPATLRRYQISFHKISNLPTPRGTLAIEFSPVNPKDSSSTWDIETRQIQTSKDQELQATRATTVATAIFQKLLWCLQFGGGEKQIDSEVVLVRLADLRGMFLECGKRQHWHCFWKVSGQVQCECLGCGALGCVIEVRLYSKEFLSDEVTPSENYMDKKRATLKKYWDLECRFFFQITVLFISMIFVSIGTAAFSVFFAPAQRRWRVMGRRDRDKGDRGRSDSKGASEYEQLGVTLTDCYWVNVRHEFPYNFLW